ncbi:ABC-type multidrug transport system fused ATPase/permease subunit [Mycoplasmoides fastidiosum]|uniref:ABC-type multidrug transport system fused ATPase/permease subunit n=1 Tax=Mycoplasmoides fastidiosum TaxID=92758 RepID=A0ABU0M083_9BACT|nr:hypothetical protein [Mycoplasmoides fastidiosum]MDQ0514258.1 ABC-type multidrug transport system fused ATPase/permease subunit [Mycoplasmoides fastidiosum]UUD37334.1 hypothetical protein NPA10_01995 [Mycoplasmoides fastidiosum]
MKNEANNIQIFKNYIFANHVNQATTDVVAERYTDSKEIKQVLKNFWKSKTSSFYKEAYQRYLMSTITLLIWIGFTVIGFSLIFYNSAQAVNVGIGSFFVVLAFINNWIFVAYSVWQKPSYYQVVLGATKIKTNYQTMLWFYGFGFTALIGKAIFDAIQSEMILLSEIDQLTPIE